MSYCMTKRSGCDNSKSPLKVVSPIIKKYAEQRHKRTKISRKLERNDPEAKTNRTLKAILPKTGDGEVEPVEPELIPSVNPSIPFTISTNHLPDEIAQPVQEICAIARLVAEDSKQSLDKSTPLKIPRKRAGSSSGSVKKKLVKQGKLVESAFELLRPEPINITNAREQAYADNYFRRVSSTFAGKNEHIFVEFCSKLKALESMETSVVKFYKELEELFAGHRELIEDFHPFLSSEQALECGVFMDHLMATKMIEFLSLVEVQFAKSPNQIKKIHAALEKLVPSENITMKQISTIILPLLKGNSVLTDFFLELLPSAPPPNSLRADFEDLDEEAMSDGSDGGRNEIWERVELPNTPDPYGGASCICSCHEVENEKFRTRVQHCIPCSKKFINGKVFIHSGKFFRRGTITFKDHDLEFHRNRLLPNPSEPRKRKRSGGQSPSKSAGASSDDHKSDLEDEDKGKKTPRSKSGKLTGKISGKCDKEESTKEKLSSKKSLKLSDDAKSSPLDKSSKVPDGAVTDVKPDEVISILDCLKESRNSPRSIKEECKQKASPSEKRTWWQEMDVDEVPSGSDTVTFVALSVKSAEGESKQECLERKVSSPRETIVEVKPDVLNPNLEKKVLSPGEVIIDVKVDQVEPDPPILVVIPNEQASASRKSPPVISIPESNTILSSVDPILTAAENSSVFDTPIKLEDTQVVSDSNEGIEDVPWKLEEDRVILHTLQTEKYCEETFVKINQALPFRTVDNIKKRFQELLNILYKMKAETVD